MAYQEITLTINNQGIHETKIFQGIKIYSHCQKSANNQTKISQRIYQTPKHNYVYYQRTDVNWNYWSDPHKYDSAFAPEDIDNQIIFKVVPQLAQLQTYLSTALIQKLQQKVDQGTLIEKLDI
ncbi:EXLDI protein [Lactobacillus xylocopicola]|uniref:EXLDI protein n=1 Tax=Lactobacillus xylocopicola TaxID=2976676 RepID=A0ABM8BFK0_9LACO|nr:EXLDI protein [Lactobacillus xylocopicola]BDR60029.1 hypothetical protein KIM322_02900 [Lactobacillus xylocopicola]